MNPEQSSDTKDTPAQQKAKQLQGANCKSIADVRQNRTRNQRKATYIKVATIILTGGATILLGLQIVGSEAYFRNIAFVLTASAALLNALEPYFNYRALWIEHEEALARLYAVQDRLEFYLSGIEPEGLDIRQLTDYHEQYREVWDDLSRKWLEQRERAPA